MAAEDRSTPRDAGYWAQPTSRLQVGASAEGVDSGTVEGRRISGPLQGFGKMWQKTYRIRLDGADVGPEDVIAAWKANYGSFWPETSTFYAPMSGVQPGEVALITDTAPTGLTLSTGVFVLYADEVSFSFLTPEGHPFAGMITFSAERDGDGTTIAQVRALIRAQNPFVEMTMALYTHRREDRIWGHVLRSLAAHLDADGEVTQEVVCVDGRRQWRHVGNLRYDAVLHALLRPFRRRRDRTNAT